MTERRERGGLNQRFGAIVETLCPSLDSKRPGCQPGRPPRTATPQAMLNNNNSWPPSSTPKPATAKPEASKPAAADPVALFGPAPRAPLAQLSRVADLAGLSQVLSRELNAARRVGTRPALLLIEVAVRSPLGPRQLPEEQAQARLQGLTERLIEIMGGRLRSRVRAADVALRVGSDRLAVILQNVERANIQAIQARFNKALSGHYELETLSLHAVLSMGAAKCEGPRVSAAEITEAAEAALQASVVDARWPGSDGRRILDLRVSAPKHLGLDGFDVRGLPAS